jgi:hypothetical protein
VVYLEYNLRCGVHAHTKSSMITSMAMCLVMTGGAKRGEVAKRVTSTITPFLDMMRR